MKYSILQQNENILLIIIIVIFYFLQQYKWNVITVFSNVKM